MIITLQQKVFAYHGWYAEEQETGHWFLVTIALQTAEPANTDEENLENTFNYELLHQLINEEMNKRCKLLETVGNRILQRLKINDSIQKTQVKIEKLSPSKMPGVEKVSVTLGDSF